MTKKRKLVTVEQITVGALRGEWLCRDWMGCPILARPTKAEALRDGRAYVVARAGRACLDLSKFDHADDERRAAQGK